MDNKQILEKAIRKALDGGWRDPSDDADDPNAYLGEHLNG